MLLTDFCNRPTTRAPVDRSVFEREAFTVTDLRRALPRPTLPWASAPFATPALRSLSANAAPIRCVLDGTHRASAPLLTALDHF